MSTPESIEYDARMDRNEKMLEADGMCHCDECGHITYYEGDGVRLCGWCRENIEDEQEEREEE